MNEISGGEIAVAHEFPWAVRIFGGCAQGNIDLLYRNSANIKYQYPWQHFISFQYI